MLVGLEGLDFDFCSSARARTCSADVLLFKIHEVQLLVLVTYFRLHAEAAFISA